MTMTVYVFGTVATAEAFELTAYHFFGDDAQVTRTGSALVMSPEVYQHVLDNTYAIPAAIVATREEDS